MSNPTAHISYKGDLRTLCTHLASGSTTQTDAPTDNHGKGEKFSPTDLAATSLAACMITIMGITAEAHAFILGNVEADITKVMTSNPRRIAKIQIVLRFPASNYQEKQKLILEKGARNCPVAKSLHPNIEQDIKFQFE